MVPGTAGAEVCHLEHPGCVEQVLLGVPCPFLHICYPVFHMSTSATTEPWSTVLDKVSCWATWPNQTNLCFFTAVSRVSWGPTRVATALFTKSIVGFVFFVRDSEHF